MVTSHEVDAMETTKHAKKSNENAIDKSKKTMANIATTKTTREGSKVVLKTNVMSDPNRKSACGLSYHYDNTDALTLTTSYIGETTMANTYDTGNKLSLETIVVTNDIARCVNNSDTNEATPEALSDNITNGSKEGKAG